MRSMMSSWWTQERARTHRGTVIRGHKHDAHPSSHPAANEVIDKEDIGAAVWGPSLELTDVELSTQ